MQNISKNYKLASIDSSHSVDSAPCEALIYAHNVRRKINGGLKSISSPQLKSPITAFSFYEILYHHQQPDQSQDCYIARYRSNICLVQVKGETFEIVLNICDIDDDMPIENIRVFSVGSILYIQELEQGLPASQRLFRWHNQLYHPCDLSLIDVPQPQIDYQHISSTDNNLLRTLVSKATLTSTNPLEDGRYLVDNYQLNYKTIIDKFIRSDYIYGAVYYIFAYKLIDGSIVCYSPIVTANSQKWQQHEGCSLSYSVDENEIFYYMTMHSFKPTIKFSAPQQIIDNELIESLVVFSTRNNPLYHLDDINAWLDYNDPNQFVTQMPTGSLVEISAQSIVDESNANAVSNIFYKIAEIDFREQTELELSFEKHYRNIEQQPIFAPNLSHHAQMANCTLDMNGRAYLLDLTMQFYGGSLPILDSPKVEVADKIFTRYTTQGELITEVTIVENGIEVVALNSTKAPTYVDGQREYVLLPNLITYPDVRAKSMRIFFRFSDGRCRYVTKFDLSESYESGMAYFQNLALENPLCYNYYLLNSDQVSPQLGDGKLRFSNRLAISKAGNPLLFEYGSILDIENGSLVIHGVGSASRELYNDNNTIYPIYIFTSMGIYAAAQDKESAYCSSYVRVTTHSVSRPVSSLSVDNVIYFISNKGVYSIDGSSLNYLTQGIENYVFKDRKFVDFLQDAQLLHLPMYGEIVIHNRYEQYAYVFNISDGSIFTRDFEYQPISNGYLFSQDGIFDFNGFESDDIPLAAHIITTPSNFALDARKRLRFFKYFGASSSGERIKILGSNCGKEWSVARDVSGADLPVKKIMSSWFYYQFSVESSKLDVDSVSVEMHSR